MELCLSPPPEREKNNEYEHSLVFYFRSPAKPLSCCWWSVSTQNAASEAEIRDERLWDHGFFGRGFLGIQEEYKGRNYFSFRHFALV